MQPVLVNSRPLRVKSHESESKLNLIEQEDQFEGANCEFLVPNLILKLVNSDSSSSGVIICYSNGTGEVITQEAFDVREFPGKIDIWSPKICKLLIKIAKIALKTRRKNS